MDGGCDCGDWRCSQRTAFGAALHRLVGGLRSGADTAELVAACEASMAALPVRTLADAAAALDVEVAALEAEGPGKVWRIAVVASVRDLLLDLAQAGRAAALLPDGADGELRRLEASWLALTADAEAGEDLGATNAAWSALLDLADAPADGLTGILIKLRALLRFLDDTAGDPDGPERRLLVSTLAAVERLAGDLVAAEVAEAGRVDDLFLSAGAVLAPIDPPAAMIAAGAAAGGVPASTARRIYASMLGALRARGAG